MAAKKDKIDFTPPKAVRAALARGLKLKDAYAGKGLREHTVAWARHLQGGKPSDAAQARRMRAWFRRHKVDKKPGWDAPPTPGYVAWLLWGADAGQKWAESLVEQVDAAGSDADDGRPSSRAKVPSAAASGGRRKKKVTRATKKTSKKAGAKPGGKTADGEGGKKSGGQTASKKSRAKPQGKAPARKSAKQAEAGTPSQDKGAPTVRKKTSKKSAIKKRGKS